MSSYVCFWWAGSEWVFYFSPLPQPSLAGTGVCSCIMQAFRSVLDSFCTYSLSVLNLQCHVNASSLSQADFWFLRRFDDQHFSVFGVNAPISYETLLSFQKEAKVLLSYRIISEYEGYDSSLEYLPVGSRQKKNSIPGVSDVCFWFSRGTWGCFEVFRIILFFLFFSRIILFYLSIASKK